MDRPGRETVFMTRHEVAVVYQHYPIFPRPVEERRERSLELRQMENQATLSFYMLLTSHVSTAHSGAADDDPSEALMVMIMMLGEYPKCLTVPNAIHPLIS